MITFLLLRRNIFLFSLCIYLNKICIICYIDIVRELRRLDS